MNTYLLYIYVNSDVTDTFAFEHWFCECIFRDFFLRLLKNYVYHYFIVPKINKRGVGIRAGELKIFKKLMSGWGRLFGTREYSNWQRKELYSISQICDYFQRRRSSF